MDTMDANQLLFSKLIKKLITEIDFLYHLEVKKRVKNSFDFSVNIFVLKSKKNVSVLTKPFFFKST